MRSYFRFVQTHPKEALFGLLLTFFSAFGQTFLISLYVPSILAELGISKTLFGTIYALATVSASFLLIRFGPGIDRRRVKPFTVMAISLLGLSAVAFGFSHRIYFLAIALVGLRFSGQGLLTHISMTVMARYFTADRGKAISISTLGYSLAEMIFPFLLTSAIAWVGWRYTSFASAVFIVGVMLPFLQLLPMRQLDPDTRVKKQKFSETFAYFRSQIGTLKFWILASTSIYLSFMFTGFFFYQLILAEQKGWTVEWYTLAFSGYAASRFFFSLLSGALIDRFTAVNLYPYHLLPLVLGYLVLAYAEGDWVAPAYLILAGITMGSRGTIKTSSFAELYPVEKLGTIRSMFSMIMIISTSTAPVIFGYLLDKGFGFNFLAKVAMIIALAVIAFNTPILAYKHCLGKNMNPLSILSED
jgi:MFS family permease